jgi:hypothetical protein
MKMILTVLIVFACALTMAQKSAGFDPKRDAEKDIANAIKLATKQNKRILLDVGGEW